MDINNKYNNTTPGPCITEMNACCRGDAKLEMGGEETDLGRLPANSDLQQRGVSKKAERIHIACKEWLMQFITVPCLLSETNAHTLYEEVSIFVSSNIKMHTTHFTVP